MRKTRESCICFSLALGGEIFANLHCEEFALLFTIQIQGLGEELIISVVQG